MAKDPGGALRWVTELLEDLGIAYQVVGGLAARCYGATRPLVDIDLYVPDEASLDRIASAAEDRLVRPPSLHRDEHWDLTFLTLEWGAWKIEIAAAATARVWNRDAERWASAAVQFDESRIVETSGLELRVMPREDLIRYKTGLGREVDRLDLEAMQGVGRTRPPTDSA